MRRHNFMTLLLQFTAVAASVECLEEVCKEDVVSTVDIGSTTATSPLSALEDLLSCKQEGNNVCRNESAPQTDSEVMSTQSHSQQEQSEPSETEQCALYLGESSIPHAGFGMYTGIDLQKGDEIADPEILVSIPNFDYETHPTWLVDDVTWTYTMSNEFVQEAEYNSRLFYPGFGAQINCHMGLNNVDHGVPEPDLVGMHRTRDPGVGAFSVHHNLETFATREIAAGSELFVDYGEQWFRDRVKDVGYIAFQVDYERADRILERMTSQEEWKSMRHIILSDDTDSERLELQQDVWKFVRNAASNRLKSALPPLERIPKAVQDGAAKASLPNFVRSKEWLQQNAYCVDNIYPAPSTVPQAGRGAFAKRAIKEGQVISPAPVMQFWRDALNNYRYSYNFAAEEPRRSKERIDKQLLLNYAYGHPNSDVLLLPYAPIVSFINHAPDPSKVNAKIQWSTSPSLHKPQWLDMDPEQLMQQNFGLLMEFVALRDIDPNEEVYIDYGPAWEEAWGDHVANWKPPVDSPASFDFGDEKVPENERYVTSYDMNEQEVEIRTEQEQALKPYPRNVETGCIYLKPDEYDYEVDEEEESSKERQVRIRWSEHNNDSACLQACTITSRYIVYGVEYFTAVMKYSPLMAERCFLPEEEVHTVTHIPREGFRFVDRLYMKDQFVRGAFRKEIGMPDGVFPQAWMRQGKEEDEDDEEGESLQE